MQRERKREREREREREEVLLKSRFFVPCARMSK